MLKKKSLYLLNCITLGCLSLQYSSSISRGSLFLFTTRQFTNPKLCSSRSTSTALESSILHNIDAFYKSAPYAAAFLTCGFKASAADFVAQKKMPLLTSSTSKESSKDEIKKTILSEPSEENIPFSFQRNLAFILYGGLYQGCVQEYIYNHIFPVWFGTSTAMKTVIIKVLFDMVVLTPFLCLPIAYLVKACIFQYSLKTGIQRYIDDILRHGLLTKYWSLWFPVQCLTFGVVPEQYRITFIACVSFFWLIILSSISTRARNDDYVNQEGSNTIVQDEECMLVDGITCEIDG